MKLFSTKIKIELLFIYAVLLLFTTARHKIPSEHSASDKYRLVWNTDPETSVTVGWNQIQSSEVEVCFGTKDRGRKFWKYKNRVKPTDDDKSWTLSSGSFNQIKWFHVFPDEKQTPAHLEIYTVKSGSYNSEKKLTLYDANVEALTEKNLFDIPANITLFEDDEFGNVVKYPFSLNK